MEYRILPHGGEKISVIGLGGGCITGTQKEMVDTICLAMDQGINYFDLAPAEQAPFYAFARAFAGRREQVITQMHFGAVYHEGKYGWSRDLDEIKKQFHWQLRLFDTDYTDVGFLHCVDDQQDLDQVMQGGLWAYMLELKAAGKIRHLGFSSHNPGIARQLLKTDVIDLMMFSINPAYDYQKGDYAVGEVAERMALYQECERRGVGISVMKPFAGGQLLDDRTSLFHQALTPAQCFQYALDRPAVLTVLPGVRNKQDVRQALQYLSATKAEKDYALISEFTPQSAEGICVYCNHCQPCPQQINVGLINKYYDLARAGDEMAKGHYAKLPVKAGACRACGHCESRCPFHVKQEARMAEIAAYFGQ